MDIQEFAYEEDARINALNHTLFNPPRSLYGHPRFYELLAQEADLHSAKNHDYAAGGNPLGNFERVATILSLYPDLPHDHPAVVALVYLLKQLDAILWGLAKGIQHKVEGFHPRCQDVSVYAKLIDILLEEHHAAEGPR